MKRAKQLPYIEPPFYTYQFYGCSGIVAMQNPTAYNHYLNNSIQLTCSRKFLENETTPALGVSCASIEYMYFFDRADVKRTFVEGFELEVIRNMIDDGYYVCFNMIDPYYVEGMLWYGERHTFHDGIICGYDDNDQTLTLAGYNSRWRYGCFKTTQQGFIKGLAAGKEMGGYDGFIGIKARDDQIALDIAIIAKNLEEYLTPDPYGYFFEGPQFVNGIITHDYLRLYLQLILEGEIAYVQKDRRFMRLIFEHKKCMADRIVAVEQKLNLSPTWSSRYSEVTQSAERAHTLYVTYRLKQKDDLLREIQKELIFMKAKEEEILPDFLKALKMTQLT